MEVPTYVEVLKLNCDADILTVGNLDVDKWAYRPQNWGRCSNTY
jgi:hypothetical protein